MKRAIIGLLIGILIISPGFIAHGSMVLITAEEAAMKDAPHGHFEIGRIVNTGPGIEVVKPKIDEENRSPVQIQIIFVPRNGSEVDLSTLRVEYLKFITVNLTERILPYTTKEGIKIERAELPSGNHTLRITMADTNGGITQEVFKVKIL